MRVTRAARRERKEARGAEALLAIARVVDAVTAAVDEDTLAERLDDWHARVERIRCIDPGECDRCRRVGGDAYNWSYKIQYAPFIDNAKFDAFGDEDRRIFVTLGSGWLWFLEQRCRDCAAEGWS